MFFEVLIKSNVAEKYFPELIQNDLIKNKIIYFSNKEIDKNIFLSILGFSLEFVDSFGFPKNFRFIFYV